MLEGAAAVAVAQVVEMRRPWWARLLGTGAFTAWVAIGPLLTASGLAGLVLGDADQAAGGLVGGVPFWLAMPLWWRIGVRVDVSGVTVQNVVRRHHVPWAQLTALELRICDRGDGRFALARLVRRRDRPVDVGGVGLLGHRRRVAWVAAVAPLLADHGVPVLVQPTARFPWRGWVQADG